MENPPIPHDYDTYIKWHYKIMHKLKIAHECLPFTISQLTRYKTQCYVSLRGSQRLR